MPDTDVPAGEGPVENAQAFWDHFATGREVSSEEATAGLALFGGAHPLYDAYRDRTEKRVVRSILPELRSDLRVLDLGCGPGRWTVPMAEKCGRIVAVDFSEQMLAHAKKNCESAKVAGKVEFHCRKLNEIDAGALGGKFDLVLAMGVLQYLPKEEVPEVVSKICACVRGGGLLIHREYRSPSFCERQYKSSTGLVMRSFYKPFDFYRQLYEKQGFELQVRRSIIPPSLLYSLYARFFPNETARLAIRSIIGLHEWVVDPLWLLFPGLLWKVNTRRPTDQVAGLFRKFV